MDLELTSKQPLPTFLVHSQVSMFPTDLCLPVLIYNLAFIILVVETQNDFVRFHGR